MTEQPMSPPVYAARLEVDYVEQHNPRWWFDFDLNRWLPLVKWLRVEAYAFLLVTDRYPPFSLA